MLRFAYLAGSILVTLFGVSVIVFTILRLAPGDPIAMMLPPGATEEVRQNLERLYGFDRTIPEQYLIWLTSVAGLDFGTSTQFRVPVLEVLLERLPATIELVLVAFAIAGACSFAAAIAAVWLESDAAAMLLDILTGIAQAIPDFLWALIFIFAVTIIGLGVPITGRFDPRQAQDFTTQFFLVEALVTFRWNEAVDLARHIAMPALALSLPLAAAMTRILKTSLEEAMAQDYVTLARARGKSRFHIIVGEALRNALIPTIAMSSVQLTFLIGGTVLIERQFAFPGLGSTAISAVINRDLPLIQGIVVVFALLFLLVNLASNALYRLTNPCLRSA